MFFSKKYRCLAVSVGASFLVSCAFVNTTLREDEVARQQLHKANTYCDALFRVYSSVSYYGCLLHAEPSYEKNLLFFSAHNIYYIDAVISGVLDTVALPYTVYRQATDGSIELNSGS